jgi:hypothetical protein
MTRLQWIMSLLLLFVLSACSGSAYGAGEIPASPTVSPTPCGCEATGAGAATLAGGLAPAGPAAPMIPAAEGSDSLESFRDRWTSYNSTTFGFSFDYPEAFNSKEFGFCTAREAKDKPPGALFRLSLGSRTTLSGYPASQSLPEAAAAFQAEPGNKDFSFEPQRERSVGNVPALILAYHSGGTNRYAETVFFVRDSMLYRVDTGTPSACDIPALGLREMDAYSHLLDTFRFSK